MHLPAGRRAGAWVCAASADPLPDIPKVDPAAALAAAHSAANRLLPAWLTRFTDDPLIWFAFKIVAGLLLILAGVRIGRWLANFERRILLGVHVDRILAEFLRNITYALILAIIVISALDVTGFPTTSLLTALGAAGLAVGLALKDSLSHIAAGVVLIVLRPFRVGDTVNIAGQDGVVEGIFIFQTRLHTLDNRDLTFMNGQVIGAPIFNYSQRPNRRTDLSLLLTHDADPQAVLAIVRDTIGADARVLREPAPYVAVADISDKGITFVVQVWTASAAMGTVRSELLAVLYQRITQRGIAFVRSYPAPPALPEPAS